MLLAAKADPNLYSCKVRLRKEDHDAVRAVAQASTEGGGHVVYG